MIAAVRAALPVKAGAATQSRTESGLQAHPLMLLCFAAESSILQQAFQIHRQ
jgi:hypothetical protein